MSSTRTASNDSALRQERYASSPKFERGLMATRVAALCETIDAKEDRELIWFIQYLSHQDGGLPAVARDLLTRYPERIGTPSMLEIGEAGNYTAEQVRKIRMDLPPGYRDQFPLKGETRRDIKKLHWADAAAAMLEECRLENVADEAMENCDFSEVEIQREDQRLIEEAERHPTSYPVAEFHQLCQRAAVNGTTAPFGLASEETHNLERQLSEMCLNPEWGFAAGGPWYFRRLVETIRDYQADFVKSKQAGVVVTALGKRVCEALDYTSQAGLLTLMPGETRTGKTFSARAWCDQHPGRARFIEVPPGNDETGFFRSLARGLGLGNFLNYKTTEIRDRVEAVLLGGDILLVLDEAQRLWPQRNLRYGFPIRVVWVMKWANEGVPIAMISTPQFVETQKSVEKCGWNSAQLTGRIGHYEPLPVDLSVDDLKAVAKAVLPEADAQILRALALYAQASERYLAAIDSISNRARWIADRAGRKTATTEDVQMAMKESVVPNDTKLKLALATGKKHQPSPIGAEQSMLIADELPAVETGAPRNRMATVTKPAPAPASRRADLVELVPG